MYEIGLQQKDLDTPSLWVDLDLMEKNIAKLSRKFRDAGVNWRPQARVFKIPAIMHEAIKAGAIGISCPKLSEAEVMAQAGINDILITSQIIGQKKIARLMQLCRQADIKVCVDNAQNVVDLGQAARQKGVQLGVLVDVNIGNDRTGVDPGESVVEMAQLVYQTEGLNFLGICGWEGTFLDITDPELKQQAIRDSIERLNDSVTLCRAVDLPLQIISGGGSVTYRNPDILSAFTEIQAGGAIFSDASYQRWGVDTEPALFVHTMVTNYLPPNTIIIDAGFKSLPPLVSDPMPVNMPNVKQIRMTPEYGIITLDTTETEIQIGDTFDFIVGYADATVLLHDQLYGVRQGVVETVWPIVGRGKLR